MSEPLSDVGEATLRVQDQVGDLAHRAGAALGASQVMAVAMQERVRVGDADRQTRTFQYRQVGQVVAGLGGLFR
jgi:hypothetical protein